jgi:hypothetical protein
MVVKKEIVKSRNLYKIKMPVAFTTGTVQSAD